LPVGHRQQTRLPIFESGSNTCAVPLPTGTA